MTEQKLDTKLAVRDALVELFRHAKRCYRRVLLPPLTKLVQGSTNVDDPSSIDVRVVHGV